MTKYFTDSPYEKEMMETPYVPMEKSKKEEFRKSLSYHNSCKFCMYYSQGKDKCKRTVCPFINERIKKKYITFLELIPSLIYGTKNEKLYFRLLDLYYKVQEEKIMSLFSSDKHKKIFDKQINLLLKVFQILKSAAQLMNPNQLV